MRKPLQGMATTRTGPGGECRYAILLHSLESIRGTEYVGSYRRSILVWLCVLRRWVVGACLFSCVQCQRNPPTVQYNYTPESWCHKRYRREILRKDLSGTTALRESRRIEGKIRANNNDGEGMRRRRQRRERRRLVVAVVRRPLKVKEGSKRGRGWTGRSD